MPCESILTDQVTTFLLQSFCCCCCCWSNSKKKKKKKKYSAKSVTDEEHEKWLLQEWLKVVQERDELVRKEEILRVESEMMKQASFSFFLFYLSLFSQQKNKTK
jgi:hypothetical protein